MYFKSKTFILVCLLCGLCLPSHAQLNDYRAEIGVLGGAVHALLVSLLICVLEAVDTKNDVFSKGQKLESILYYRMEPLAGLFFPAAKDITEQIYKEINDATERI